jgi:hypothetical protein
MISWKESLGKKLSRAKLVDSMRPAASGRYPPITGNTCSAASFNPPPYPTSTPDKRTARLRVQTAQSHHSHGVVSIASGPNVDAQLARIEPHIHHLCAPTRSSHTRYLYQRNGRRAGNRRKSHRPGSQPRHSLVSKPEAPSCGHDRPPF